MSEEFDSLICEIRVEHVDGRMSLTLPDTEMGEPDSTYISDEDHAQIIRVLHKYLRIGFEPDIGKYGVKLREDKEHFSRSM